MYPYGGTDLGFHPRSSWEVDSPRVQELKQYLQLLTQAVEQRRERRVLSAFDSIPVANDVTSLSSTDASESTEASVEEKVTEAAPDSVTVSETETQSCQSEDGETAASSGTCTEASEISLRNEPLPDEEEQPMEEAPVAAEEPQIAFPVALEKTESSCWSIQSARMALRSFAIELA